MPASLNPKIITRDEAVKLSLEARQSSRKVGYTSGVFDLLHPGHVQYLHEAQSRVDILIVGLNSDSSVRTNKGPQRPINPERERAEVLAGLSSVDYVFIFDEANNNLNVELLRPHLYLKAGDYAPENLSSKKLVEAYGGGVEVIPFRHGVSSSGIIERVLTAYGYPRESVEMGEVVSPEKAPAVFLDRDGTVIEHVEYLHEPAKVVVIPGVLEAIKKLRAAGYRIVLVTNQPGIGMGYFTKEDFFRTNAAMLREASKQGAIFDRAYFCPHSGGERCACRKPGTAMIDRAVRELNIDLGRSWVIGDMTLDLELARRTGCKGILVRTGQGGRDNTFDATPVHTAESLVDAAEHILSSGLRS